MRARLHSRAYHDSFSWARSCSGQDATTFEPFENCQLLKCACVSRTDGGGSDKMLPHAGQVEFIQHCEVFIVLSLSGETRPRARSEWSDEGYVSSAANEAHESQDLRCSADASAVTGGQAKRGGCALVASLTLRGTYRILAAVLGFLLERASAFSWPSGQ